LVERVAAGLAEKLVATERDLAGTLAQPPAVIQAALTRLCRLGRAIYDVESRAFRHRELFADPIDEAQIYPADPRTEKADAFLARGEVHVDGCEPQETRKVRRLKTPDGLVTRTVVHRDWRVVGRAGAMQPVEIVIDDQGRVIFGKCPCAFFEENLLSRGPCEHMIALHRASEPRRQDLPSSFPASDDAMPKRGSVQSGDEGGDTADEEGESDTDIDGTENSGKK
jgi:hypothetical protein